MLSRNQQRNLLRIIPFGVIWSLFGLLYVLIEHGIMGTASRYPSTNNVYEFQTALIFITSGSFVIGTCIGIIEILVLNNIFLNQPFWKKLLFKTTIYLLAIIILSVTISAVATGVRLKLSLFHPKTIESVLTYLASFAFLSIVTYSGVITILSLFILEVSNYMGGNIFRNFFTGKYYQPKEEERIFMFLDMKSSTTIAEKLGHVQYFHLLNQYYADTTDAIIQTAGEVYQYAGDEIIVSWDMKTGLESNNCIQCFFSIKETFRKVSESYHTAFGLVPEFKAGFHCGKVTTGEIGVLKKEIFFTGDILNTTARIQSKCNELNTDNLVSQDLISLLNPDEGYVITAVGEFELRGRQNRIDLFTIKQLSHL